MIRRHLISTPPTDDDRTRLIERLKGIARNADHLTADQIKAIREALAAIRQPAPALQDLRVALEALIVMAEEHDGWDHGDMHPAIRRAKDVLSGQGAG